MKILVLGSEGQIGKPLCKALRDAGHAVIEYDIVRDAREDLRYIDWHLSEAVESCDFVMFLAADIGGSKYLKDFQSTFEFIHNNVRILANTFGIIKRYNKPFLYTSSQMSTMGTYSAYGAIKRVGEYYTQALGGIVVQFWNVYGNEFDLPEDKWHIISDLIHGAATNNNIKLRTDGSEVRQLLYVDDCCKALMLLMENDNAIDRTKPLHITSFEWITIKDVANIVSQKMGNVPVIIGESNDSVQQDKRNEPDPYILEMWKPETSLEDGIQKIIDCYAKYQNKR